MKNGGRLFTLVLQAVPLLLLAGVALVFGLLSPRFLTLENLINILVQTSSLALLATGMTYVLLTGGIDLSAGSVMFLSTAVMAKLVLGGAPPAMGFIVAIAIGLLCGGMNGWLIVRLKLLPFIVTLAALYSERGLALYLTETRAMNLPESILRLGSDRLLGIPLPVWLMLLALGTAQLVLSRTAFGRHIYACGHHQEAARRAGVRTNRVLLCVYVIGGGAAAFAGLVSVAQLGAMSPTFGLQREFAAIAAAALGGTSLFGGRGSVLPGALLGSLLIQTVENGLVIVNADPYLYPMVLAGIIFLAVVLDGLRQLYLERQGRRTIRALEAAA